MNITIPASISNKTVSVPCGSYVVANNNNYYLRFSFDEEWNEYALKTARFVIDEEYVDIDFSGDTVNIPAVTDSTLYEIHVGVYAGDLSTTTPARLLVYASVLGLPTSGQYQPDDPGTLLPNIEELALDDTFVATDVSEGERGRATMQQIVDLAEAQFGVEPYDNAPLNDGTASAGTSPKYARGDHRHPTDAVLSNQINSLNNRAVHWDAKWGPDSGAYVIPESALAAGTQLKLQRGSNAYAALPDKQDKLTAGANINIDENNVISATGGEGRFAVTYGVTTYAQIASAYANGRVPVCEMQGDMYELSSLYTTRAIFKYNGLEASGSNISVLYCTNNNVWSTSTTDFYSVDEVDALAKYAVKYTAQNLTDNQKAQARTNIGAASLSEVGTVMSFKGAVATVNDLPSTNNRVGDVYYVVAASTEYVWITTATYPNGYWEQFGEAIDMSGFVATTAQTLTAAQQAQARSNVNAASATTVTQIGNAVSAIDGRVQTVERYAVRADIAQELEATEQAQARTNIGAYSAADAATAAQQMQIALQGKQDALTFDADPTDRSSNPVTSDGIARALNVKLNISDISSYVPDASSDTPSNLGTAAAGVGTEYARADHVHKMPSASDVGALASNTTYVSTVNGQSGAVTVSVPSASSATPQALGTAAAGSSADYSRADHVHSKPTAADIGAAPSVIENTISTAGAVSQNMNAGEIYHFTGALTALTIAFNAASGIPAQYHFDFTEPSTAFDPTLPSGVKLPDNWTWEADMRYEVDILNNYAVVIGWEVR